jgi:hypothetical protein
LHAPVAERKASLIGLSNNHISDVRKRADECCVWDPLGLLLRQAVEIKLILRQNEKREAEGEHEDDEDDEEAENVVHNLASDTDQWRYLVHHGQELLRLREEEHLAKHKHDSQNDGLLHVRVVPLIETAVVAHLRNEHDVLYHDAQTDAEDGEVDPRPESVQVTHTHHPKHEAIDAGLNQYKEQVEHEA